MALTKHNLGQLLELTTATNSDLKYGVSDVRGMTITKQIIPTKADVETTDLSKFLVVQSDEFVFNPRTHGKKIGLGYNNSDKAFIISWNNIAFRVKESMKDIVLSEYLFLHFNREEWDREACFRSWGSSTEVFSWDALCEMELYLPSREIQKKYVDIYNSMLENQRCYERGIGDLRIVMEGHIDKLRRTCKYDTLANYIELSEEKNDSLTYGIESVRGVSIDKKFINTKADMANVNLRPYYTVHPNDFAYVSVTSRNGEKISIALNDTKDTFICSSSYIVFRSKDTTKLLPQYLMLYFSREEFNRYARFNSWGSARETFDWADMLDIKIPIPSEVSEQKYIANIYNAYQRRREINEQLKAQLRDICPILIRGSIEEGARNHVVF